MRQSALETFVVTITQSLRRNLARHDRGVLLGLMLAMVPILPTPLIGLAVAWLNARFVRQGKIGQRELAMVRASIYIAIVSSIAGAALLYFLVHEFVLLHEQVSHLHVSIPSLIDHLPSLHPSRDPGQPI